MGRGISRGSTTQRDASRGVEQRGLVWGMDQFVTRGPLYPEGEKTSANCNGWGEIWEPEGCGPIVVVRRKLFPRKFVQLESCRSLVLRLCIFFTPPFFPLPPFSSLHGSRGEDIRKFGGFWKVGIEEFFEGFFLEIFFISFLLRVVDVSFEEKKGWERKS